MSFLKPISRKIPGRIVIFPKDVMIVTGKSDRRARFILQDIRKKIGKQKHQYVTITEFCAYMGMDERLVREFLCE